VVPGTNVLAPALPTGRDPLGHRLVLRSYVTGRASLTRRNSFL